MRVRSQTTTCSSAKLRATLLERDRETPDWFGIVRQAIACADIFRLEHHPTVRHWRIPSHSFERYGSVICDSLFETVIEYRTNKPNVESSLLFQLLFGRKRHRAPILSRLGFRLICSF